jgi:hypothetical protein
MFLNDLNYDNIFTHDIQTYIIYTKNTIGLTSLGYLGLILTYGFSYYVFALLHSHLFRHRDFNNYFQWTFILTLVLFILSSIEIPNNFEKINLTSGKYVIGDIEYFNTTTLQILKRVVNVTLIDTNNENVYVNFIESVSCNSSLQQCNNLMNLDSLNLLDILSNNNSEIYFLPYDPLKTSTTKWQFGFFDFCFLIYLILTLPFVICLPLEIIFGGLGLIMTTYGSSTGPSLTANALLPNQTTSTPLLHSNLSILREKMIKNKESHSSIHLGIFKLDIYLLNSLSYSTECPICYNNIEISTNCSHGYCCECLNQMFNLHNKCAICRNEIYKLFILNDCSTV